MKMWTLLQMITSNQILNKVTNLSQLCWGDVLSILPETYLLIMILIALVLVGTSNFVPASNEVEKKKKCHASLISINHKYLVNDSFDLYFPILIFHK